MPRITLADFAELDRERKQFVVGEDDFADLEFNPKQDDSGFHWFRDRRRNRLVTEFVLDRTPQTLTYCEVKLIAKGPTFEPRLHLKKDNRTQAGWERGKEAIESDEKNIVVKASIDLSKAHENFWRLATFLSSFEAITVPGKRLSLVVADEEAAGLVDLMKRDGKPRVLEVVKAAVGGALTESDVRLLVDRKAALAEFEKLIHDHGYIERVREHTQAEGEEKVWQRFFEDHPWIFGYGLKLIAAEGLEDKLEQTTTGASAFDAKGDRVDALMATKGLIQSLMFTELKTASTKLIAEREYRSGVYPPTRELAGAVSQVQTTAHRAIRRLEDLHRPIGSDGWPTDLVGTIRPRLVVVVGTLGQFRRDDDVNHDRYRSFELYRRSIDDVEIITFDELLARARYIARHEEPKGPERPVPAPDAAAEPSRPPSEVTLSREVETDAAPPPPPPPTEDDVPF
jgi:hypothetical protein